MMRTPHAQNLLHRGLLRRTALAACLSAGAAALAGCVSHPVNTNSQDIDGPLHVNEAGIAPNEWEKSAKDPAITPDTFYAAGQLAESRELWNRAVEQYDKALKINPNHLPSLYRLGVLYARFKQFPKAIVVWQHYLKATGGDPTGYANVGFCYELAGQFEEAQDAYESGIRRDPNNAPCRVNYGLMLSRRGRYTQAMHEWQIVLPPAEVYYNLGSAYESADRKEQAKIEFRKALELDPQMADARARLGALGEKVAMTPPPAVAQAPDVPETPASQPTTVPAMAATAAPEMVPATAPSNAPAAAPVAVTPDARPDTMPAEEAEVPATAPSTQPVASDDAPTTAPTAAAPAPTTSPVTGVPGGDHPEATVADPPPQN